MEFKKLPLVVKATQWFNFGDHPDVKAVTAPTRTDFPAVPTIDNQVVNPGDWIVQDGIGKAHVVSDSVFQATHEAVESIESDIAKKQAEFAGPSIAQAQADAFNAAAKIGSQVSQAPNAATLPFIGVM